MLSISQRENQAVHMGRSLGTKHVSPELTYIAEVMKGKNTKFHIGCARLDRIAPGFIGWTHPLN